MKTRHWNFLAFNLWLFSGLGFAVLSYLYFGQDFRGYYAAALALRQGGNPYDYHLVAGILQQVTGHMGNNPFYYPPWLAWLVFPLTFLPFEPARAVWMALNWALWALCLRQLTQFFPWPAPGWRRYLFWIGLTFSFAWITWRYEQTAILTLFAFLQAWRWVQRGDDRAAAFWLLLALLKPNISLLPVLTVVGWLYFRQRRRVAWWLFLFLTAAGLIFVFSTPQAFSPWLQPGFGRGLRQALDGPEQVTALRINTTLFDWLTQVWRVAPPAAVGAHLLAALAGLIGLWRSWRGADSMLQALSLGILFSLLLTPYALQYDYPLLVFPFWQALFALREVSGAGKMAALGLMTFVFSVSLWQQNIAWGFWMVVGTAGLWALAQVMESRRAGQTG